MGAVPKPETKSPSSVYFFIFFPSSSQPWFHTSVASHKSTFCYILKKGEHVLTSSVLLPGTRARKGKKITSFAGSCSHLLVLGPPAVPTCLHPYLISDLIALVGPKSVILFCLSFQSLYTPHFELPLSNWTLILLLSAVSFVTKSLYYIDRTSNINVQATLLAEA